MYFLVFPAAAILFSVKPWHYGLSKFAGAGTIFIHFRAASSEHSWDAELPCFRPEASTTQ